MEDTKITTVILDVNGLMVDTEEIYRAAWDYAGEKTGIGKAGYMVYKTLGMDTKAALDVWKEEFKDKYNQEEMKKYAKEFLQNYYVENKVPVKQGLYELLDCLKQEGYRLAAASSLPEWEVENHLKSAGIYGDFEVIVCGDMIRNAKPDSEIYLKVCELMDEKTHKCYVIEDSQNGILAANHAGCRPLLVQDLRKSKQNTEGIMVWVGYDKFDDLNQVADWLKENRKRSRIRELGSEIERLKYDIDGRKMEIPGLEKKYKNIKIELIINIVVCTVVCVFLYGSVRWSSSMSDLWAPSFRETVDYGGGIKPFVIMAMSAFGERSKESLSELTVMIQVIMGLIFYNIIRLSWKLYINSAGSRAKEFAKKHHLSSLHNKMDEAGTELSVMEKRLRQAQEEYEEIKS